MTEHGSVNSKSHPSIGPVLSNNSSNAPERASWGRPLEFILACMGYAIGLGNVWRFPYLAYRNGGGAFLILFFIMLIFLGLPLFYLELYIGQYTGVGPIKAFSSIAPFFSGLGYCTLVVMTIVLIYYMVIVAWILFYFIISMTGKLNWGLCDNEFNTIHCFSGQYDEACRENNTNTADDLTYYLRNCTKIGSICESNGLLPLNGTHCLNGTDAQPWYIGVTRTLASEEYYNERVLGRGDATWENWGSIQWHLVGTLFLSWLIAFCCVIKGVQSAGKVVYFTALFPYVMLTALLIRGVTLEGAVEGILFFVVPDWELLATAKVWGDAASQIFYSFGLACGSLVTLASYSNFYNNCHFDAVFVSAANFLTSIYAGLVIFSVLGFQAHNMGVSVSDVAEEGAGLIFVAYPEAILQMPIPVLWSILFFFMLFILGLGSQFAGIEAINTAIVDRWPHFRKSYWKVTAFTCTCCFLLGLPMCFSGGVFLLTLLEWNTATWAVLLIGIAECVSVSWCYGINRAIDNLRTMKMKFYPAYEYYWKVVWIFILPIGSLGVLIFKFSDWTGATYGNYVFPLFADLLGWAVGLSTIILFPVGVAWAWYHGYRGKALFTPTEDWKPAENVADLPSDSVSVNGADNYGYLP
ncbi:sodium- and chloride-dependent glycine transporter 1-like isoform X2 [Hyposmocoma kahamanoa]|uniref:sodium- and chloride-dependent glycine transporter 1-like isoform X2 n=1 Tax=Hyposmocoma kahamanoa TaxID=1477025 RepID=UPI000E6D9737|nr:sodium- and chloride-dependent glycine transporter 1-like isoform X2 [Hyposmocoma kahamanoa]